jgi:hypothetical protein
MALPKLNDVPKYDVIIPSTKQEIRFRPFLVKEQKILLMALETKDQKSILNAITDTLKSCIIDEININRLTSFDVEYLFTQIRAKSVGESTKIGFLCTECEAENEVAIKLDDIAIDVPKKNMSVRLNDQYTIDMKYPTYMAMLSEDVDSESGVDQIYNTLILCLDKLKTDDDIIEFANESKEEIMSFIEQLSTAQFEKIMDFINSIPSLHHELNFDCTACGHENKAVLQGINDFF